MKPEIEAKFLDVDHADLRKKLQLLGAECRQSMRLMRRKNFDFSDGHLAKEKQGWVRVRDEGDKITLSYKQLNSRELDGTHEVNLTINDFDKACDLLEAIGLKAKTFQETKRESWTFENFEIELDEWPWAKPYIEIEGPDEASLRGIANRLGLDWATVCHGSVEVVYRGEYDVTDEEIDDIPLITFDLPIPELLKAKQKPTA